MSIFIPEHIQSLSPYTPGTSIKTVQERHGITDIVKLASNENPLGASPKALEALRNITSDDLSVYPDGGEFLCEAIAQRLNIKKNEVVCYNGSDALLHLMMRCFTVPGDTIVSSEGTFVGYYVATSIANVKRVAIPLTEDYKFDIDGIIAAIDSTTRIVYIANANNPTGTHITKVEFEKLLSALPDSVLLIMDEAYYEYTEIIADDYPNSLLYRRPNMITLRTFSKVYGLASLRVGYAIGPSELIGVMSKSKLTFDPGTLSQIAAVAAMKDNDFLQATVQLNKDGLSLFQDSFAKQGWKISPSVANFSMIDCGTEEKAIQLTNDLEKKGIIVRRLPGFKLPHCVRISTGTQATNERVVSVMKELIAYYA
ncbi:MAG: histidinol-phosphate transaminase [Bacteroidetes bacterium]|nr:histidinol-phosphate transaminase [bacterium]NBP63824.1 histidinol-phosphate transaminase [Bacteroidota bacterium]